jgi:hypothetical protein
MQALRAAVARPVIVQACIGHLARRFAAAILDGESLHRAYTIAAGTQRFRRFLQAKTERTNDTCSDDGDARSFSAIYRFRLRHFRCGSSRIPLALPRERRYSSRRKKTVAREVGGLSVEFISGGSKSDEREQ